MFAMACKDLRLSPAKTALTGIGMLVGVLAVIATSLLGTVGNACMEAVNARISGWAPTYAIPVIGGDTRDVTRLTDIIDARSDDAIAPLYTVDAALSASRIGSRGAAVSGSYPHIVFTTAAYGLIYHLPMASGRWLSEADRVAPIELVLNRAAEALFGTTGDTMVLTADRTPTVWTMPVTGVADDGANEPRIYVNAVPFSRLLPQRWHPNQLTLLWHPLHIDAAPSTITSAANDIASDTFNATAGDAQRADNAESYERVLAFLTRCFAVCSVLILIVSMLGLANIGLASIRQRSRELLIRRAVGASRGDIIRLVLMSDLLLGLAVSAAAIAISVLAVRVIVPMVMIPGVPAPNYPHQTALLAVSAAVLTALAGGAVPAIQASRLEPALALR